MAMQMELIFVTPEMAASWLEASKRWYADHPAKKNRGLSKLRMERLMTAIKAGEWEPTNQGICIGKGGIVVDGQHRCSAIVETGIGCQMFVLFRPDLTSPRNIPVDIDAYPRQKHWVAGVRRTDWEVANIILEFAFGKWTAQSLSYKGSFSRKTMVDVAGRVSLAGLSATMTRVFSQVSVRAGAVLAWQDQGNQAVSQYAALINQNHNDMWPIVGYLGSQLSSAALKGMRMDRLDTLVKAWKAFSRTPGSRTSRLKLGAADSRLAHETARRFLADAGVTVPVGNQSSR